MDSLETDEQPRTDARSHPPNAEWLADLLAEVLPADQRKPKLERLDRPWFRSMIALVVEVGLQRDSATLDDAADAIHRVYAAWRVARRDGDAGQPDWTGWLLSLTELVAALTQRIGPTVAAARIPTGSLAARFLAEIIVTPGLSNREIIDLLGVGGAAAESQVSRAGRKLLSAGLADRVRLGGENRWSVTPRGTAVHRVLQAAAAFDASSTRHPAIGESSTEASRLVRELINLRKRAKSVPDKAEAAYRLGVHYRRNNRLTEAVAYLEDARELQERTDDYHGRSRTLLMLAQCYMEGGRFESATRAADQAIEALNQLQKPPNTPLAAAHLMAGRAHLATERSISAEEWVGAISPHVEDVLATAVAAR